MHKESSGAGQRKRDTNGKDRKASNAEPVKILGKIERAEAKPIVAFMDANDNIRFGLESVDPETDEVRYRKKFKISKEELPSLRLLSQQIESHFNMPRKRVKAGESVTIGEIPMGRTRKALVMLQKGSSRIFIMRQKSRKNRASNRRHTLKDMVSFAPNDLELLIELLGDAAQRLAKCKA